MGKVFYFPLSYSGLVGRKSVPFDVFALPVPVIAEHPLPVLLCSHNLQVFINNLLLFTSRSAEF